MKKFLFTLPVVTLLAGAAAAQDSFEATRAVPMQNDLSGLTASLSSAVNRDTFRAMGFDEIAEARDARLGMPVQEYFVYLDELREYDGRAPVMELLHPTGNVHIPVNVRETTKSSIIARRSEGKWQAVAFGQTNFMRAVVAAREALRSGADVAPDKVVLVTVPAFNLYFLGYEGPGGLRLKPVISDRRFDWMTEDDMPAAEVFEKLQPLAREHKGEPG